MNRSPPYYITTYTIMASCIIESSRGSLLGDLSWGRSLLTAENWYLRAETTMDWWRVGQVTDRVTESSHSWLCPTITGSIASSPHTGQNPTNAAPNEFWQICGFGLPHYNSNTASKVGTTMESGNELSLSDQTVQYTEIIGTGSRFREDWREELQYQPALDYVTDSETLNLVKICCWKEFSS